GIAILPDYLIEAGSPLVQLMRETEMPQLESYLVYPEEMKSVARVQVFRDFLIQKSQRWTY
ncbi:MAG: LysR family transcriptional regulator, partial [Afipia sp.]|nr:LysR family transcriptional regulator [Afipia sp.]